MKQIAAILLFLAISLGNTAKAQFDEDQLGAWYMYFWNTSNEKSNWGWQGDVQFRNWNLGGDLEQLLLRGGLTYVPENTKTKFTLGYGYIQTGEFGSGTSTVEESRIYQEALIPHNPGGRFFLKHRFRYEQRFVQNQDLRTRYRYNLFLNIPFNGKKIEPGVYYLALYNELFINGQRNTGTGSVQIFDRNRLYGAVGYHLKKGLKVQLGMMRQTTDNWDKKQVQLSLHHVW
ncbi:MAG: DUF2490 domain-containing protein [Bacteroidia bacterium]|nr:DUF2490 domain-containing protein [Bacteroidia bacterium]